MDGLSYAAITPARDEAANLRRLADALELQTVRPDRWLIVDNGSTDDTVAVAESLARRLPWVRVVQAPAGETARPGAPVVRAFHRGLAELDAEVDVVVKLDADVTFAPAYFELLLAAFAGDPGLGIASGTCWERDEGRWHAVRSRGSGVRGASRAYRRACLDAVLPLPESMGWDGLDELKAAASGWHAYALPGLPFYHHRAEGARDGGRFRRAVAQGEGAHFMGYRVSYLLARAAYRSRRDRAAVAMVWGYARAALARRPRYDDVRARELLRRQQSLRGLLRGR